MKKFAAVATPWILAMLLTACGGGGGGPATTPGASGSHPPGSSSAPSPAGDSAPASDTGLPPDLPPPPTQVLQAGAFAPFGPVLVASDLGYSSDRGLTSAARLTGGGSVVAWVAETAVRVQRLDPQGQPVGAAQDEGVVLMGDPDVSTRLSVVATADGGWLVAWIAPDRTVLFRRHDAAGAPLAQATPVDVRAFTKVLGIQARGLADGGFVVGWVAADGTSPTRAYLRRFSAAGSATTDRVALGNDAGAQTALQVATMPDGAFLAAWVEHASDGTESLLARRLDAGLRSAGPVHVLQAPGPQVDPRIHRYGLLGAASLSQRAALFAWAFYDGPSLQVRWQLLDASGTPAMQATVPGNLEIPLGRLLDSVEVIPAAAGFRIVAESNQANYRLTEAFTTIVDIGGAGEILATSETPRVLATLAATTGAGCGGPGQPGVAAGGGEDGHYLLAYATCAAKGPAPQPWPPANLEVVGR